MGVKIFIVCIYVCVHDVRSFAGYFRKIHKVLFVSFAKFNNSQNYYYYYYANILIIIMCVFSFSGGLDKIWFKSDSSYTYANGCIESTSVGYP